MNKSIKKFFIPVLLLLIGLFAGILFNNFYKGPRTFATRHDMCLQFATDYLDNIERFDSNWKSDAGNPLALNVEMDLEGLCNLPLNSEATKNFKSHVLLETAK